MALVSKDVCDGGRIGAQYLAGSGSGGVTRPARVSGVKKLLTYASCAMECRGLQPLNTGSSPVLTRR